MGEIFDLIDGGLCHFLAFELIKAEESKRFLYVFPVRPSDFGALPCLGPLWMHLYPVNELIFTTTFWRSASALIDIN
jgi:hypothetical protein